MKPLSICMFSNLFPPIVSGSSTQSASLARELAARGHKVSIITAQTGQNQLSHEVTNGFDVYRLPAIRVPKMGIAFNFPWLSYTFTPSNVRRIDAIIRQIKPDVLHLHNHMFDLAFSAVVMRRRFGIPLVATIHTMIKHANPLYNLILYPADRLFLKYAVVKQCDGIISPDANIEEYVTTAFAQDNTVVPYGISMRRLQEPALADEIRQRHGLIGKRIVLSLGHLHEIRNRRDLIAAFPKVLQAIPDARLVIVGTEGTTSPREQAQDLGIEHAVVFTGAVPHHEVPAFLAIAEIEAHWLNQDDPEKTSLGIASLEAMSAGLPILAAANPDTYGKGMLSDNENIILVKPGKPDALGAKILQLLNDPAFRMRIGQNARQTVEQNFTWESVCSKTLRVYENAAGAAGRPSAPQTAELV